MSAFPPGALALIVLAAFVHVVPHVAIKGAREGPHFIWWMLFVNGIAYAPLLWFAHGPLSLRAVAFIVASGLAEIAFLVALSRAYATGALSVVYPLSRGTAPLFLLLFAIAFLHERPTIAGMTGLLLIACGVYLLNVTTTFTPSSRTLNAPGAAWARALAAGDASADCERQRRGLLAPGSVASEPAGEAPCWLILEAGELARTLWWRP